MQGWESVDTARCQRCAIYTPTSDLVLGADGRPYCIMCGVPATSRPVSTIDDVTRDDFEPTPRAPLETRARLVAALMVLATVAFPLAACVSQL